VHQRNGFTPNVTLGRDTNNVDYTAARGKLRFKLSRDIDSTFSVTGVEDRSTARGVQNLAYGDENAHNQIFPLQRYDAALVSNTTTFTIDSHLRAKALIGYTHFSQTAFFDNTGDFYGRGSQLVTYRDTTRQIDLQLNGDYGAFGFTTGLYLYNEDWFTNRRANTAANATTDPAAIRYRPVYTLINQGTENRALYGEARYKATPALTLAAGLRYNHEWHSQDNQLYNLVATAPFQSNASNFLTVIYADPQALVWDAKAARSWNTWAPRVSADYQWRTGLLQYLTYSEGTKSAGYDYRAQGATTTGLPPLQAVLPYNPEKAKNLETGLKADWLDGTLRTNAAAFYTRFEDIQLTTTDPTQTPPVTRRFNAGQGSTRGLELEAAWLPQDGLQIDANAAYVRARLDRFDGAPATLQVIPASAVNPNGLVLRSGPFAGAQLPNAPKLQARLAATWRLPLAGATAWLLNGSASYQAKSYTDTTNNPTVEVPAQTYLNGAISVIPGGGAWTLTLAGQNLANNRYALGQGFTPRTTPAIDGSAIYRTTNYNDPRTFTLTLKYEL
jgi:iron complex outermembrane receptor protein